MSTIDPVAIIHSKLRRQTKVDLSRELGVSAGYLGDVASGRKPPSERILSALGIERVYRRKKVAQNATQ